MSTYERLRRLKSDATATNVVAVHQAALELAKTHRTEALTLGSLGLAAWSVLASSSEDIPASSLDVLLVGVVLTIVGPTVFRRGGTEGNRMGLEATISVGYAAIVIAVVSFIPAAVGREWLDGVALVVTAAVVARDILETRVEMSRTEQLLGPARGAVGERAA